MGWSLTPAHWHILLLGYIIEESEGLVEALDSLSHQGAEGGLVALGRNWFVLALKSLSYRNSSEMCSLPSCGGFHFNASNDINARTEH